MMPARAILIAMVALAGPAYAACADPATCGCTVAASALSFGRYDPQVGTPTDSVGTISVTCASNDPGGSSFSVGLSGGDAGSVTNRRLRQGGTALGYNLYTNASHATIWGDDAGADSVAAPFPPNGGERRLNIYGRIPPRQNVGPGTYSDTIVVTVTY